MRGRRPDKLDAPPEVMRMSDSPDNLRELFHRTVIVRKPTYGIISGYHELPYICVGAAISPERGVLRVRGTIQVSPRFVIRPTHYSKSYGEIFGEDNVDMALAGRVFGFLGFPRHPVECSMEGLEIRTLPGTLDEAISASLDEMERQEDITTGVFITPDARYYPVSVEAFIASVLEDEFSV